jgi:hypothetical protein
VLAPVPCLHTTKKTGSDLARIPFITHLDKYTAYIQSTADNNTTIIFKCVIDDFVVFFDQSVSRSEEPLLSIFRSRFFRGFMVALCALVALLIGYYALLVLGAAFSGNGSVLGGAVLFAFGLILLILAPSLFAWGVFKYILPNSER